MPRIPGVGDQLGPYRITRQLGAGGMGVVYEALEDGLGRRVALKVLSIQLAEEPEFRARFAREATVLARSDSPHIIQVYSHGEQDGCLYLATQYVPGGDLAARVAEDGVPEPAVALDVAAQVAAALADAHAVGVVHRDVKPHNVLLRPGQGQVHAYLCDFGIARDDESALTSAGVVAGTYAYLAPERFRGEPATAASDVYALGCLVWFLLTGRAPYDGGLLQLAQQHEQAPVPQLPDGLPRVNEFLRRAMAKDPADRPASAARAAAELRSLAQDLRAVAPPTSPVPQAPPPPPPPPPPSAASPSAASPLPAASPVPGSLPTPSLTLEEPAARRPRHGRRLAVGALALVLLLGAGGAYLWDRGRDDGAAASDGTGSRDGSGDDTGGPGQDTRPVTPADVGGTRADDVVLRDRAAGRTYALVSADGGFGDAALWADTAYDDAMVVRGDVDADGHADLVLVGGDEVRVARSDGAAFAAPAPAGDVAPGGPRKVTAGDFDGDGATDLAFVTQTGDGIAIAVARADDGGFGAAEPWIVVDGWSLDRMRIGAGDVDGDGNADLVELGRPTAGGIDVQALLSTGSAFEEPETWYDEAAWDWETTRVVVGEYTGDRRADLVAVRAADGALELVPLRSDGGGLTPGNALRVEDLAYADVTPVAGDIDGDGRSDVTLLDGDGTLRLVRGTGDGLAAADVRRTLGAAMADAVVVGISAG